MDPNAVKSNVVHMPVWRFLWKRRNLLKFFEEIRQWPGDLIIITVASQTIVVIKHPDLVHQLLVTESGHTIKTRSEERQRFFSFLGDGLLNTESDLHKRQRRLVLPSFQRGRIGFYIESMSNSLGELLSTWKDGQVRNVTDDMMALTLMIVSKSLFSYKREQGLNAGDEVATGFRTMVNYLNHLVFPGSSIVLRLPLPFTRRMARARIHLDRLVFDLIAARRATQSADGDLLSALIAAEDAEHPGEHLTDKEIRDQIMTFFFAGQDTTANALIWVWWLLSNHPETEATMIAELRRVLGGRGPGLEDIDSLPVTNQIVTEAMRLYPPVWTLGRKPTTELSLGGCAVPHGALVLASQWLIHRDARWFDSPLEFRPSRWTPEFRSKLPRFAYFPFGGGPRSCLGEHFAWTEIVVVLATIAQNWKLSVLPESAQISPSPKITLGPDRPVFVKLEKR